MTREDDKTLIKDILNQDERSLHKLVSAYEKPLIRFIYRQIGDMPRAEELVQDTFINVLEGLRDFRYQCSLKTYIYTIARNTMIDSMRRKKLKQIVFSRLPSFIVESIAHVFLDETIEKKELQKKFEQTLQQMPHDYELILRLKYIENNSVEAIAARLVRSFKSTESLLFRARKLFIKLYSTETGYEKVSGRSKIDSGTA